MQLKVMGQKHPDRFLIHKDNRVGRVSRVSRVSCVGRVSDSVTGQFG